MSMYRIVFRTFRPRKSQVSRIVFLIPIKTRKCFAFLFQISRLISSAQVPKEMAHDPNTYPISAARTVFNGTNAKTMFTAQTASLPELAPGEILVKVSNSRMI